MAKLPRANPREQSQSRWPPHAAGTPDLHQQRPASSLSSTWVRSGTEPIRAELGKALLLSDTVGRGLSVKSQLPPAAGHTGTPPGEPVRGGCSPHQQSLGKAHVTRQDPAAWKNALPPPSSGRWVDTVSCPTGSSKGFSAKDWQHLTQRTACVLRGETAGRVWRSTIFTFSSKIKSPNYGTFNILALLGHQGGPVGEAAHAWFQPRS